jgi:hypothetical protein
MASFCKYKPVAKPLEPNLLAILTKEPQSQALGPEAIVTGLGSSMRFRHMLERSGVDPPQRK